MGQFHIDKECEKALINLNDTICTFERETGREYTLIFIPHQPDEMTMLSQNGKPVTTMMPEELLMAALRMRDKSQAV